MPAAWPRTAVWSSVVRPGADKASTCLGAVVGASGIESSATCAAQGCVAGRGIRGRFQLRDTVVGDYAQYVQSFLGIRDRSTRRFVEEYLEAGNLWPDPLVQLNPSFQPGATVSELVSDSVLHAECERIFRTGKTESSLGVPLQLDRTRIRRSARRSRANRTS